MSGPIRGFLDKLRAFAAAAGLSMEDAADTLDRWNARETKPTPIGSPDPDPQVPVVTPIAPTDPPSGKVH